MHLAIRSALATAAFACSIVASAPAVAFESLELGVPMCSEDNIGEHAVVTEVLNGQAVQIVLLCNGTNWVEAVHNTNPQIENDGIPPT